MELCTDDVLEYSSQLAALKEKFTGPDEALADLYYNMASLAMNTENVVDALRFITRTHEIAQQIYGDDHPLAQEALEKIQALSTML